VATVFSGYLALHNRLQVRVPTPRLIRFYRDLSGDVQGRLSTTLVSRRLGSRDSWEAHGKRLVLEALPSDNQVWEHLEARVSGHVNSFVPSRESVTVRFDVTEVLVVYYTLFIRKIEMSFSNIAPTAMRL